MSSLCLQLCFWVAKCQNKEKKKAVFRFYMALSTVMSSGGLQEQPPGGRIIRLPALVAALTPGQQLGQNQGKNTGSEVSSSSRALEEENPVHEILEVFAKVLAAGPWAPCEQMVLSRSIWIGDSQMLPLGPCATWRNMLLCSISWDRNSSNILSKFS